MRVTSTIVALTVALDVLAPLTLANEAPADPNHYLDAVRESADNVLKYGRDMYEPKRTPLFVGDPEKVQASVADGIDINCKGGMIQNTTLHSAAADGRTEIVQYLLGRGADVNAENRGGQTPFALAQRAGHNGIVESPEKQMQIHDVAVTEVSAPTSCVQGETVAVVVGLDNRGDVNDSRTVTLTDTTDDRKIAHQSATIHLKNWAASEADVTFTGEMEEATEFGNWICADGDVNGDGFRDLLITAHHYSSSSVSRGRAYLFHGGPRIDNTPDKVFTGEDAGDTLGDNAGCLADINHDDFADVILGARYHDDRGRVYVFYGGPDMDETADVVIDPPAGDGTNLSFGRGGMVTGDFNGDGIVDLICSAVRYKAYTGRAYLYYGPLGTDVTVDKVFTGERTDDTFGAIIKAGDVDGDHCDDLLIATRYYPANTGVGRAYLYYGGPGTSMDTVCDVIFGSEGGGANEFGSAAEVFDIDKDGHADVMIAARTYGNYAGRVCLYWGNARGSFDNVADVVFDGEANGTAFGGDFVHARCVDDDPYADVLVTAYAWPHNAHQSRAYLYCGSTQQGLDAVADCTFTGESPGFAAFRSILADLNNDGFADVVMGGTGYNNKQGRVLLWYGPFNTTTDITLNWDTTNALIGKHTLRVEIPPVPGEQNTEDNVKIVTIAVKEPST